MSIPKKSNPDKWCLIIDLSLPHRNSINDGISEQDSSPTYIRMEGCCRQSFSARSGHSLIAKNSGGLLHAASPSGMDDRQPLGMQWEWQMYIDASLPFGRLSAPSSQQWWKHRMDLDLKEWLMGSSLFRRLCLMCNQPMIGPRDLCRSRPKCTSSV